MIAAMKRWLSETKQLLANPPKPWSGVVGSLLALGLLSWAAAAAVTDNAFAVCLVLGIGALFVVLCWLLAWAGDAQENGKGQATLRRIESLWRYLGLTGLLGLAVFGLNLSFDKVIDRIPGAAAETGWHEKAVSASTVIVRTAENSMGWPQAVVLLALVLSMTAIVVALIYAAAQYFRD
jgi:hypothetical protein